MGLPIKQIIDYIKQHMIEKKYGIIGKPLSHSLSPVLHNFWFKKYNIKAIIL